MFFSAVTFLFSPLARPVDEAKLPLLSLSTQKQKCERFVGLGFEAKMDPERVRAYLQVACAGLGFDIGEIWWTETENGLSTVAAIGTFGNAERTRKTRRWVSL